MFVMSFITALFTILAPLRADEAVERRNVRCDVRMISSTLKPGGTGELELLFSPDEGTHVTTDPPLEVVFAKLSPLRFTGMKSVSKISKTNDLDAKHPVLAGFIVDKKCKSGKHVVKGTVQYSFCSDAEGWCSRATQPFELTFTVTP